MKKSGSITIFLSLIFVCVCALVCGLVESARTAGVRYYMRTAVDSSIDSVFSEYHRELWNKYRLLLLECEDDETASESMTQYMEPYVDAGGWYNISDPTVDIIKRQSVTDQGGVWLEQEILDYMKYGVFTLAFDEDSSEKLWDDVSEAESMNDITNAYGNYTKEAVAMEKSITKIAGNLSDQNRIFDEALDQLKDGDNGGFQKKSKELSKIIDKLPGLIKDYETKSKALGQRLSETREEYSADYEKLSESNREILERDISSYESYTKQDGERHKEIEKLRDVGQQNKTFIEQAQDAADEVEETIEDAEDDEDSDEDSDIDEDRLWEEVIEKWNKVDIPLLGCAYGIANEEKESQLEVVKSLAAGGILDLVMPKDRTVSDKDITKYKTTLPTVKHVTMRTQPQTKIIDKLLINEYAGKYFTNFTDNSDKEFKYELEYMVSGEDTDKKNLESAITQIMAVREGMNYAHILMDAEKMKAVNALAQTIAGVTGLPILSAVVACLVIGAWAFGETLIDMRALLEGKKVPFIKNKDNWVLDLDAVLEIGTTKHLPEVDEKETSGIDYETYLKFLILVKADEVRNYRMMDMIQLNMITQQDDFLMSDCIYGIEADVTCQATHLFTGLSISAGSFAGLSDEFGITAKTVKAY